ncbi:DUF664 domain-containing protein [Actinoplanes sp. NPDC051494]|uniref:mycothiol transferase n=1 Tax=Actinoplanes sp. NPDC051494 TaxID=3363907 RepID=UPI0037A2BF9D
MTYPAFPDGLADERELLLRWLGFLRGAVLRKASGITDEQSRWQPDGKLIPLVGIVHHLTNVEWRWIDGEMRGEQTSKAADEYQAPGLSIADAIAAYQQRAQKTDEAVRAIGDLSTPGRYGHDTDLRFVLLHLINETARHSGHADAVRELLDGTTGE